MTNMTVDGGRTFRQGSNASQINNVGLDFIQEVKIQTSNFSAEYGRNSGAQVNRGDQERRNQFTHLDLSISATKTWDARNSFAAIRGTTEVQTILAIALVSH